METTTKPLNTRIFEYLQRTFIMQLATVREGQPWCCNVRYVADKSLNLYWASLPETRHSQELHDDQRVAAAVAVQAGDKPLIGIQIEGDAILVSDTHELPRAARLYCDRYKRDEAFYKDIVTGTGKLKLYRLKPRLVSLFDLEAFPNNPKQEWRP